MAILFEMHQGDTEVLSIAIVNRSGEPVDLTGATAIYAIRDVANSPVALVSKSIGNGIIVSGSTLLVSLDPADTGDLLGIYYNELEIRDYMGNVSTTLPGEIRIKKAAI
jgi:hypothetical protein